ncbi:MAG: hypothetical protein KBD82_17380 [Rhodoferax sp.]|jgi:disulfide bond formation protein DsbB|uniref:hypothetical protein n=1 Tax=Rhodoferax sp. TaxID=50421 RepID=UPI001B52A556|nr:hypothetical protein [Rhodoferax sp.]MBP9737405.1 hypothetical protein [Rhodoferax sp.]
MEAKVLPSPTQSPSNVLVWVTIGVALVGAVYFGIASCGGYASHKEFFRWFVAVAAVVALIAPSRMLGSLGRKVVFPVALFSGYLIIESAVAPFYPGPPQSFVEYGDLFMQALRFGPCG